MDITVGRYPYGTVEERVERGIALLDARSSKGVWAHLIDLDTLDISNERNCILGQLYGNYFLGKVRIGIVNGEYEWSGVPFGFCSASIEEDQEFLDYWKKRITELRSKN